MATIDAAAVERGGYITQGDWAVMYTKIIGTGSYLPEQVRTNRRPGKMVETSDEWIVTRTGIRERRMYRSA